MTFKIARLSALHQAHRAYDTRLVGPCILMNDAQPVFFPQCYYKLRQRLIRDAVPKLPVERVRRRLLKRITVDILDSLKQLG